MKKLLRKSMSLFMALFMVLQVMLPAFATKSKAEEAESNSIKNIENLDQDPDTYFSLTDSQKIYDKKEEKKDESKFTIAIGLPDTITNFRLVKRNDLKLYDDRYFPTNEEASKEYWKIKDKLKDQGLDIEIDIIKDDQGYKIVGKNQDQDSKENPYGINYSYIDFKIIDDFDFNEKGNQKLLEKDKLVFNLEFSQNISPDPSYNLFEKDQDGNYEIKNHGQIFALIDNDKANIYDTSSLSNDFNELNQYKEDKKSEDERKKLEEDKKAQEEKKKAEEEKKEQEAQKQKEEAEKKVQEEKAKAEEEKKLEEEKAEKEKLEKESKEDSKTEEKTPSQEKSEEENKEKDKKEEEKKAQEEKENQEEAQKAKEDAEKKAQEKKKEADKKLYFPKKEESPKSIMDKKDSEESSLSKADKELKEALKNKKLSLEDLQKLLTSLGEKYKLNKADQEKLMTENDKSIRDLVEKDRQENFRALMLRQAASQESNSFDGKKFNLKTTMKVKAAPGWPIPSGWYFDVNLGPYLKEDPGQPLNDLYYNGQLIATSQFMQVGNDTVIRYTYVRKVTKPIELNIDQNLKFNTDNIGSAQSIDVVIKVAPKNNPVQTMTKTVNINDASPVSTEFVVKDEGETQSGTYPYQLDWRTTSQKLKDNEGKVIDKLVDLDKSRLTGAYVEWDIEVDTDKLVDPNNKLDFNNLNLTVFGSANQGLTNIYYKASKDKADLDNTTAGYTSSTNLGELLSQNSQISKNDLGDKLYIKVKATIDPNQVHETYSIGFRINPDNNYIKGMLDDILKKYKSIPSPLKWIKGVEGARRFAEVPFNLVETNIPATFLGLTDRFTNERFYYDNTRTITANRKSDTKVDWYALDLLRRGESQDPALDNPDFDKNNGKGKKNIRPKKVYYLPLKDGGYRRTTQAGDVVLQNGQYFPGTIVSYEYTNHSGKRDDTYNFRPNLKDKKKFNIDESYDYEGGRVNLFTEKISDQDLANGYIAYTENPYPIMRINRNFDLVSCFNDRVNAPVYTGNTKVFLDKHEDVSGDYLITRLNESHGRPTDNYSLRNFLAGTPYNGVSLNHNNTLSQGQAMEELMKKIYFYGEEVKKEYAASNNNKEMHRMIEASMYQRVIHHFTDGKSLKDDYFQAPSSYNIDEWKVDHTLSGIRQTYPKTGWDGSFAGSDETRRINNQPGAPRKLKDNETKIGNYPPVQSTQYDMAKNLYNKVIASYRDGNDWNADKADSVKLVFYSHTDEGKYQELIAGRVMAPIEIDKYKKNGDKLKDAKFRFTNIETGEKKEWTSTDDNNPHKLYLRPGKYKVQEIETPQGFEKIKDFDIEVIRKEIYPDDGSYDAKKLPRIHVNDGFETEVTIDQTTVPKDTDGKTPLVELDKENKIKVKVTNIEDNLGKLEFIKRNKFIKLDGAEFRLRKIEAKDLDDAKTKFKDPSKLTYDSKYNKTEKGNIGEFKFDQILAGFYVLEETKVPQGYEKAPLYLIEAKEVTDADNKKKVEVSFVDTNLETEKATRDGKKVDLPIIRNKTKKTEIKFRKVRTKNLGTDKEHLGLGDAKFRLMSLKMVDGDFYMEEAYTDNSTKTTPPRAKVDGQQAEGGGYITFKDLKVGEYLLEELEAPKGYKKTDLYGWKLVVSLDEKGNFTHNLYEVPKAKAGENQDKIFNSDKLTEVKISEIINNKDKIKAYQIGNDARTIDIDFKKYKGKIVEKDGKTEVEATEVNEKLFGKNNQPVSFNLYKSDFYGAIIGEKDEKGNFIPINKEPIIQDDKGIFHLKGLEFGGYYILRETNPPKDYNKADDILLKVEAEAIANEGKMKVIVRDPNTNAKTDLHSVFKGVVDFLEKEKLGKFSIKKVGNAIGYTDKNGNPIRVGLRRAYFRLYTANEDYEIEYKDKDKKYPKEYIQKVTPGVPITQDDGKGGQTGKSPEEIEKEAPNQGIVTFDQLKPGHYVLEEFRGPAGYERDPNPWYILVERDGTVRKYRDNPSKTRNPKQMDYSTQSVRFKMAGLDISEKLSTPRLMATPKEDSRLKELSYKAQNTEDLDITVKASDVDTKDGNRTINLSISPKDKVLPGKKVQMVFLVERSKDSSLTSGGSKISDGRTQDKNINYAITQIAKKAKETGTSIDVSFVEYTYNASSLKTTNASLNEMTENLGDNDYSSFYVDGEGGKSVSYKDYIGKANLSKRNDRVVDGSEYLNKNIDTYLSQISAKDGYDKKIMIDFANFNVGDVKKHSPKSGKYEFYKADLVNKFKNNGFDTFVTHIDQRSVNLASGPVSQYAYETMPKLQFFEYFNNSGSPGRNSASYYVYSNMINKLFENEAFKRNEESYLVKDASLKINLKTYINLVDAKANIGANNLTSNISKDSKANSLQLDNINLKKGESLEFSYTVDLLNNEAEYNTPYEIVNGMKISKDGKDIPIERHDSTGNYLITKKIKEDTPTPDPGTQEGHSVITSSTGGGSISANPQTGVKPGTKVTITITPDTGKKLSEILIDGYPADVDGSKCTFEMPDHDVNVEASFIDENTPHPTGDMILKANFIYSNQKDGIDDSKSVPKDSSPGTVELFVNKRQGLVDNWVKVPNSKKEAPYKGTLEYTGLDLDSDYKLVYTRDTEIAGGWGSETVSEYRFESRDADENNTVTVNITNGNLVEIFNHDETGFRIPLRITKVNENKAALTGSQFKARKLVNGERVPIYEKKEDGTYVDTGKVAFPKYYAEKYDGVSEATGKPGDNYFRELTPGIYELEEIKTPDNTYRPPKDKNGNPMKWYFKVVINKEKVPRDANYMDITFDFEHTFSEKDDFNIGITEAEKKELIGKTIKGFKKGDPDFARYIEEVKDDGRSDPARPDAPYKWIHDARVTNYKNKTKLNFFKKDKASYQNIGGAEFSLRKAKLDNGKLVFGNDGKPEYEKEPTTDSKGDPLTKEQLDAMRVQPYDDKLGFAKKASNDQLGVEFTNIGEGTYILEEIKLADGFKPTDSFLAITFTEDEKGSWKEEIKGYEKDANGSYKEMTDPNKFFSKNTNGELVSVKNEKAYIDLKFQKIEGKKGANGEDIPVESADFKLTQVDKNGKKVEGGYEKTIYSYANSNFEFKYLPIGRYKLQETRAITKFEKPDPWFFNVVQDEETHKLKIVFENDPDGTLDKSIGFKTKANGDPDYDKDGNYQDLKIRNYSKTNFSFMKFRNETDEKGNKLPLKDAYFRLTKVRFSMDEGAKAYEYHNEKDGAGLKKYVYGKKVTEYDKNGKVDKYTYDGTVINKDDKENYKPDEISSATGKYSALRRSQSSGKVDFQNLGEGIYQLEEVGIPEGYQSDTKQFKWIFKVEKTDDGLQIVRTYKDSKGKSHDVEEEYFQKYDKDYYDKFYSKNNFKKNSNITGDGKKNPYEITNTKTTTDLKWKKIGGRDTTNIIKKDTKFVLLKTSNDPNNLESAKSGQSEFPPYQVESDEGNFEITNLAKGVYVLKETKAPDGYDIMDRQIGIKIYEDSKGVLQKEFFEIKTTKEGGKDLVKSAGDFQNLLNRNAQNPETHVDKDGTFYVINKSKPYFFNLYKGFMEEGKFKNITKGKLKVKIYADPADEKNTDTNVYEQTIDLSKNAPYRIDLNNNIQFGRDYLLEEVKSPDGYAKTNYRYKLRFAYNNSWDTPFVATLVAVLKEVKKEDGTKEWVPLTNKEGKNISDSGQYLGDGKSINSGFPFQIVNKKTEVVFTKKGKDKVEENGKLVDKETPLKGVEFYLEKQDPDDIQKENQGYYPLTKDMKYIKSEVGRDKLTHYYIEEKDGKKTWLTGPFGNEEVTPENSRGIYKSDTDGKFKITNLTDGYYRVIEPKAAKDADGKEYMRVNGPIKTFKVVDGKVKIYTYDKDTKKIKEAEVDAKSEATVTNIINEKPGKGEFELTKVDENDGALDGVEFTLYKIDGETKVGDPQTTDDKGEIKFTGLPYGYYWLKETKTKNGYILDTKKRLISLGGDKEWKVPEKPKDDVSKSIIFDGSQDKLVSTADTPNKDTVYPNKAEGIFAKYKFKIDEKADIKPGDYFTIHFSDNVDLDGINKDYYDKGQKGDQYFNIIGPAGLLAKAKVNDDRRSITYTFTEYVKDYKPESMSMFLQLFPNRRKVDHTQDITVTANIGKNIDTNSSDYHYSDSINIDYRGYNDKGRYNGYQNPKSDISSYMLRLDPEHKTFTAIVYYNPWNKYLTNKNITFTADEDIIQNSLSVKTYRKSGWGSHRDEWETGDLPDSYDVDFTRSDLKYISDFYRYDPIGNTGNTRKIYIPNNNLTQNGYNTNTYVIEIKGKLAGENVKSLKTRVDYKNHNVFNRINGYNYYENTYTGNFETWSQFFNPGASGNVNKEIKLVNFKNKIEFAKVDGGVLSNVVDKTEENPNTLKDLGIGNPLKEAEFKLVKDGTDVDKSTRTSDDNGIFSWEGLAPGKYQVIETKSPDKDKYDLPKDGLISSFTVDDNGNIVEIKDNKQILENYRKAEIKIRKTDQEGNDLKGAKFLLTPTSGQKDPSNPSNSFPALTKPEKDTESVATFSNLVAGKYTLTEERAPKGYTKSDKKWEIEVTKDGKVKWTNSFDDKNDMKKVSVNTYSGDADKDNLKSEILGIDTETKTFRQKITIKAKPSELEKARLILDSVKSDLKLSQTNTKVRLVQTDGKNDILKPDNTTYTVEINNGNKLSLSINPPYREEKKNNPVGSSSGNTTEENKADADAEREYQFIVDMPYKDDTRIGAKATYQIGSLNENDKVTFNNVNSTVLDRYATKANLTISDKEKLDMKAAYEGKYLARDINLLTTDIGNIKKPDIYFKKVDADKEDLALAGAKFEMQKRVGDDYVSIDKNGNQTDSPTEKWTAISSFEENTKGQFEFKSIPDGEYRIIESKAPSGYILFSQKEFKFKVIHGKIYYIDAKDFNISKTVLEDGEEIKENTANTPILITNKKAQYPSTGGPGVWIGFMVIGLILMFTSVLTYFKRKDKLVVRK